MAPAANNPLSTPNATPDSATNKKAAADLAKKNNEKKSNPLSSLFHLGKKKVDKDKKDDSKKPDQPADASKPADPNKPAQPDDAKKPNVP